MNRPPPYFPQNQLSPPDEKRYRKFKIIVGLSVVLLIAIIGGIGYGIYYLISNLLS
jgi:preprotein translocase subunit Sss1